MFLECLKGGESLSLLLTATLSWEISYIMTRRASLRRCSRLRHLRCFQHVTNTRCITFFVGDIEDLKWESHINNICGKANKTLGFLRRNLNIGSTSVKEQAYKALVRPSLEYACSVWDPNIKSDINKIEMVQRKPSSIIVPTVLVYQDLFACDKGTRKSYISVNDYIT
jgi:hypothetical protein